MNKTKERKGLSGALKKFYGVGDMGFNMMANVDTFYASYFFTNIAKFSLDIYTISTTISAVVDAILSTMYGGWLNKMKPRKWGRYRSWLILTPWMVPILYAMQYVKLNDGFMGIFFITLAMITSRIAWNIPFIANISMINIAGKNTDERMQLSSVRTMYTSASSVLFSFVGPAALSVFASFLGEANSYAATAFAFGVLMVVGYYAHFKMFEGYEETGAEEIARMEREAAERDSSEAPPKVSAMKAITCNPNLIALMLACTFKYMVMFMIYGLGIYFFTYVSQNAGLLATFMFIANLVGIVAAPAARVLVGKIGAKKTQVLSFLLIAAFLVAAYFVYSNATLVLVLMSTVIFFVMLSGACDMELFATCSIYSSQKLGYDTTGTVMGLSSVPIKIGVVARGILIAATLKLANFDATIEAAAASEAMKQGLSLGFMILPAVAIAIGALFMIFGFRLGTEKKA